MPARIVTVSRRPAVQWMFETVEPILRDAGYAVISFRTEDELHANPAALADADVLFAPGDLPVTRAMLLAAPRLRGLVCPFTGTEGFDQDAATELGVVIANGQTSENSDGMAEATILLALASLYDLHGSEAVLRDNAPKPAHSRAFLLRDKTVGLLGYGQIARAMTRRLAGWGVRLQAWSRRVDPAADPAVHWVGLEELLRTSDVVCVLLALNAQTRGLLDATRLALLKPSAVLVNTARGGIIDEAALLALARDRPAMRIALDTFEIEPLPPDSPLRGLPNTILTPHMLGHTVESHQVLPGVAVEAIARILAAEPPRYVRNPAVLDAWRRRWAPIPA